MEESLRLAEDNFATPAAKKLLKEFRTGTGPKQYLFKHNSQETKELLENGYFEDLTKEMVKRLIKKYNGSVPFHGAIYRESKEDPFPNYGPIDFLRLGSGVAVGDIVGSFTYPVIIETYNGEAVLKGINEMTVKSFYAENTFKHGKAINPLSGPFSMKTHEFHWKWRIPYENLWRVAPDETGKRYA